ncbi:MAG: polysaccharide biosynthesis C-terminal domain-containing protein [Hyphomicrobium sp.]
MAWLVGSRILRVPINVLILALLARALGPQGVGIYALTQGAAVLLHSGLLQWLQAPLVFFGRPEWDLTGSVRATLIARLPLLLAGMLVAVALVIVDPGNWLHRVFGLSGSTLGLVALALLGIWLMSEAQSLCEIAGAMRPLALAPLISDGIVTLGLLGLWLSGNVTVSVSHVLLLVYSVPVVIWGSLLVLGLGWTGAGLKHPQARRVRDIVCYGWPLLPGLLISWTFEWSGPLIIEHFHGKHEVGLYQVAFRISQAMLALSVPLTSVLMPMLISQRTGDPRAIRDFLANSAPTIVALWLLLILPILAVLPEVIGLFFGERFQASAQALAILSLAVPGSIIITVYGAAFTAEGRLFRTAVLYSLLMTSISLAATVVLVPRMGMIGAAAATAAGYLAVQTAYFVDQHRRFDISMIRLFPLLAAALALAACFAIFYGSPIVRLVLGIVGFLCLGALVRHNRLVHIASFNNPLQPPWDRVGGLVQRLLCPQR